MASKRFQRRRFFRIKVVKAIYAYLTGGNSLSTEENNLLVGLDKSYDLYPYLLSLIVDVKRYAEERIQIGLNKHLPTHEDLNPNRKFINNEVVARIENDEELEKMLLSRRLGWSSAPEVVKHLYQKMVESDYYKKYMASDCNNFIEAKRFVEDFYIKTVQDDEMLVDVLEETSLMWCDDLDFTLLMVLRTIGYMCEGGTDLTILPQYKDVVDNSEESVDNVEDETDDDKAFVKRLFAAAAVGYDENLKIVEQYTKNWDVERIAMMDNIILTTAIAEMVGFDSIPVKVTLDEYIEIAKFYSTLGSSTFINGLLDKISSDMISDGRILKQGRGLVEF